MIKSLFVSDLHGNIARYRKLIKLIASEKPELVFIGGDLLPGGSMFMPSNDFIGDFLIGLFSELKTELDKDYPDILIIMGNDDPRIEEGKLINGELLGLWHYLHKKRFSFSGFDFLGYAHVPPTPFQLKDWERYDVSRYVDVGSVDPLQGYRTVKVKKVDIEYYTIAKELDILSQDLNFDKTVFLFHSPPYQTYLDRAALDGKSVDHVPLDVNVGSIAIKRFIEKHQPYLTLHGHVHESSSITGYWHDQIAETTMFSAAWDGEELAVIIFDLENLESANRLLL